MCNTFREEQYITNNPFQFVYLLFAAASSHLAVEGHRVVCSASSSATEMH